MISLQNAVRCIAQPDQIFVVLSLPCSHKPLFNSIPDDPDKLYTRQFAGALLRTCLSQSGAHDASQQLHSTYLRDASAAANSNVISLSNSQVLNNVLRVDGRHHPIPSSRLHPKCWSDDPRSTILAWHLRHLDRSSRLRHKPRPLPRAFSPASDSRTAAPKHIASGEWRVGCECAPARLA